MSHAREPVQPEPGHPDPRDPRTLLQPRVDQQTATWISDLAGRKAFRVRGFSWFRETVLNDISRLLPYIPSMEKELAGRQGWLEIKLDWRDPFSPRQVYAAANRQPLQFVKAAKTILLCECAAVAEGYSADEVFERMRIEPSVYRISDFNRSRLQEMMAQREDIIDILVRQTGQQSSEPFFDMAKNKTVSWRLATRTLEILNQQIPKVRVGTVVIGLDRTYRHVTKDESVEGASLPDSHPPP